MALKLYLWAKNEFYKQIKWNENNDNDNNIKFNSKSKKTKQQFECQWRLICH